MKATHKNIIRAVSDEDCIEALNEELLELVQERAALTDSIEDLKHENEGLKDILDGYEKENEALYESIDEKNHRIRYWCDMIERITGYSIDDMSPEALKARKEDALLKAMYGPYDPEEDPYFEYIVPHVAKDKRGIRELRQLGVDTL